MRIRVQVEDFDAGAEINLLSQQGTNTGAVVSFTGLVRDLNDGASVLSMILEHYPGMTEKALVEIVEVAKQRWDVVGVTVVHRVGELKPTDQIVFVGVSSVHRKHAFNACEFIMDYLKTEAPFWKKETTQHGERWVEAKVSDDEAKDRWDIAGQ